MSRSSRSATSWRARTASDAGLVTRMTYVVIVAVGVAALVVALAAVALLSKPTDYTVAAPTVTSIATTACTDDMWRDPATGACQPRVTCAAPEVYAEQTNTCVADRLAITAISPATGQGAGGTPITIEGSGFSRGARVSIDGEPATDVEVVGPTTITAVTPTARNFYPVDVVVKLGDNTTVALDNGFTYVRPTFTGVSPPRGPTLGGTRIKVRGSGFVDGTTVMIGRTPADGVRVVDDKTITATTPLGPARAVDVTVTVPGLTPLMVPSSFTYVAPQITAVRPAEGSYLGGTEITIKGSGFVAGAGVTIGGTRATKVEVVGPLTITAVTPPGEPGAADVVVRISGIPAIKLAGGFNYLPPSVESIKPTSGSELGGTLVTIKGDGFTPGARVAFQGRYSTEVTVVDEHTITAVSPAGKPGKATVAVLMKGFPAFGLNGAFTYKAAPSERGRR